MQGNIEKIIKKTLKKSSAFRAWRILFLCACIIAFVLFLRFFVFSVWKFEGKRVFVCEFEFCKEKARKGNLLLVKISNGNSIILRQIGKSGDKIKISTPFDTLSFSIPKKGDTIIFEDLNPMLWDAAYSLHREQFPDKKIKTNISLSSKEKEIPFSYVGRASISGRPASEKEVPFLPWQELRLLELQLQKIFPAIDSIHFKRKVFLDSLEITDFTVEEELFYLSCEKPRQHKLCYDSREKGFFRRSEIKGRAVR
ncbi:MAG: hypothetical protein LBC75_02295 [Fibromonadaceae bacterium]|jgi:signal peptidase I|nr:hypothetical protein [Fibromonadaceae bacterium]